MDNSDEQTVIDLNEPVMLTFALRYLNSFTKATPLASSVIISLAKELPVVVEYRIQDMGHIRWAHQAGGGVSRQTSRAAGSLLPLAAAQIKLCRCWQGRVCSGCDAG